MKYRLGILGILLGWVIQLELNAQVYTYNQLNGQPTFLGSINEDPQVQLRRRWEKAEIVVKASFGEPFDYKLQEALNVSIDATLKAYDASNQLLKSVEFKFIMSDKFPLRVGLLDLKDYPEAVSYSLKIGDVINGSSTAAGVNDFIENNLTLELGHQIWYGTDVHEESNNGSEAVFTRYPLEIDELVKDDENISQGRWQILTWQENAARPYPNYEVQILRLYNYDEAKAFEGEEKITAKIDWRSAMSVLTYSDEPQLELNIMEGTGFYVWRVRPIGTYFPGGIADSRNYGEWSKAPENGEQLELSIEELTSGDPQFFFLKEQEENINWSYSRMFIENGKTKEVMGYVDGLLNARQSQAVINSGDEQSDKYRIVSQNYLDFSGRPTLSTMAAPVDNGLEGFVSSFVTVNEGGENVVYSARHFDKDENLYDPTKMEGGPLDYYSNNNPDKDIPSAQGYPFSRTVLHNDGTGRVKEIGRPGKVHSLGPQDETPDLTRGRTARTYYSRVAENELLRIFGAEAPAADKTYKVISIDPNNTVSITYMGNGGVTLATCLAYSEDQNGGILNLPQAPETLSQINFYKSSDNTRESESLVSQQMIYLEQTVTEAKQQGPEPVIKVHYSVNSAVLIEGCSSISGDCDYHVYFELWDVEKDELLAETNYNIADDSNPSWIPLPSRDMIPGAYLVKKILVSKNKGDGIRQAAYNSASDAYQPFVDLLVSWLHRVPSELSEEDFVAKVQLYNSHVNDVKLGAMTMTDFINSPDHPLPDLDVNFTVTDANKFLLSSDEEYVHVETCCEILKLKIGDYEFDDPSCENPSQAADDMIAFFEEKIGDTDADWDSQFTHPTYGVLMTKDKFKDLINNMLAYQVADHYIDDLGVKQDYSYYPYSCGKLWGCWVNVVESLGELQGENPGEDKETSVGDEMIANGDGQDYEEAIKESTEDLGFIKRFFVNRALHKVLMHESGENPEVGEVHAKPYNYDILWNFMECVDFQPQSMIIRVGGLAPKLDDAIPDAVERGKYIDPANGFIPFDQEPPYPGIHNVNFIYKYFVYEEDSRVSCEINYCYEGPKSPDHDAYRSQFCDDRCWDLSYEDWDMDTRKSFFRCIQTEVNLSPADTDTDPITSCNDPRVGIENIEYALIRQNRIEACQDGCESRREEFYNLLVLKFETNCYKIDEACPDDADVVTEKDINTLVDQLVAECKTFCPTGSLNSHCRQEGGCLQYNYATTLPSVYNEAVFESGGTPGYPAILQYKPYVEFFYFTECEKGMVEMANSWEIELSIPNRCKAPDQNGNYPQEEWATPNAGTVDYCDDPNDQPTEIEYSENVFINQGSNQ